MTTFRYYSITDWRHILQPKGNRLLGAMFMFRVHFVLWRVHVNYNRYACPSSIIATILLAAHSNLSPLEKYNNKRSLTVLDLIRDTSTDSYITSYPCKEAINYTFLPGVKPKRYDFELSLLEYLNYIEIDLIYYFILKSMPPSPRPCTYHCNGNIPKG